jgi:hypothetical protein
LERNLLLFNLEVLKQFLRRSISRSEKPGQKVLTLRARRRTQSGATTKNMPLQ